MDHIWPISCRLPTPALGYQNLHLPRSLYSTVACALGLLPPYLVMCQHLHLPFLGWKREKETAGQEGWRRKTLQHQSHLISTLHRLLCLPFFQFREERRGGEWARGSRHLTPHLLPEMPEITPSVSPMDGPSGMVVIYFSGRPAVSTQFHDKQKLESSCSCCYSPLLYLMVYQRKAQHTLSKNQGHHQAKVDPFCLTGFHSRSMLNSRAGI